MCHAQPIGGGGWPRGSLRGNLGGNGIKTSGFTYGGIYRYEANVSDASTCTTDTIRGKS